MIRARISEIIGNFAVLEFGGITKIMPRSKLPTQADKGDIVVYRNGKMVLDAGIGF